MSRARLILVPTLAAIALLAGCSSNTRHAVDSSLKLSGSTRNTIGQDFAWKISGVAGKGADRLVAIEQFFKRSGCAATYTGELARETQPSYMATLWLSRNVGARYSVSAQFGAEHPGVHGLCAYLIRTASRRTTAHASGWWDNLPATSTASQHIAPTASQPTSSASGRLEPAALGSGDCQASRFTSGDVYAQIATSGATCVQADDVAERSDSARGAAYRGDGFSCSATAEGASSQWSSAWGRTYYAYSCVDGSEQVAFNWGTDYTY
jgi:hypothetical protein